MAAEEGDVCSPLVKKSRFINQVNCNNNLLNNNHQNNQISSNHQHHIQRREFTGLTIDEKFISQSSEVIAFEVSSTTPSDVDINGGDSGFQELNEVSKDQFGSGLSSYKVKHRSYNHTETIDYSYISNENLKRQLISESSSLSENHQHHKRSRSEEFEEKEEEAESDIDRELLLRRTETVDNINDDNLSDAGSDISDISCSSYLSNMSGENWKPISGPINWIQQQISCGADPRDILQDFVPNLSLSPDVENLALWRLIVNLISEPPRRKKLPSINTLDDVVSLIKSCKKIIVLTGAGVSVSCGIPDFRSRDGIYARLSKDFPDLPDPQAMFDIHYFRKDQRPFYKFAKEIYPGLFHPSLSHQFIHLIEKNGKLLRNYSQNIDTLEKAAGIERVITCHGSFATASCTRCKHKLDGSVIKDDIFAQRIPKCPKCPEDSAEMAVMKPDIVFFGEGLSEEFHDAMAIDKENCDLLIVIGSSLKVRPVALIPSSIPDHIPQILINRERLSHLTFDVELLGDCDIIVQELCNRLGESWTEICEIKEPFVELKTMPEMNNNSTNNEENGEENKVELDKVVNQPEPQVSAETASCSSAQYRQPDSTDDSCNDDSDEDYHAPKIPHVTNNIPDNAYLFCAPNRYIFKGAEIYEEDLKQNLENNFLNSSASSSSSSSSSSLSSSSSSMLSPPREVSNINNQSSNSNQLNSPTTPSSSSASSSPCSSSSLFEETSTRVTSPDKKASSPSPSSSSNHPDPDVF